MTETLTSDQWATFEKEGFLRLGKVLSDDELAALRTRIDDIMMGRADLDYERLMMQREGGEGQQQSGQTVGFKGPTLNYRKIENLEYDALFMAYITRPLFRHICDRIYGNVGPIACYRAMFMNKPAYNGTPIPYHQDRWPSLSKDPRVSVWTALDPSTRANGCVKFFAGTHLRIFNPAHSSSTLTDDQVRQLEAEREPVYMELEAGEAVMMHNWAVHGSDANISDRSRRGFSVCFMEGDTVSENNQPFTIVFDR